MNISEIRKQLEDCLEKLKLKDDIRPYHLELKRKMVIVGKIHFHNKEEIENLIVNECWWGLYIYIHTDDLDSYIIFDDCYLVKTKILGGNL